MQKLFYTLLGSVMMFPIVAFGLSATVQEKIKSDKYEHSNKTLKVIQDSATSTKQIAATKVYDFGAEYLAQGACIRVKDADGSGVTYLTTNNGTLSASTVSCE